MRMMCGACRRSVAFEDGLVEWTQRGRSLCSFRVVHIKCARSEVAPESDGDLFMDHHLSHFVGALGLMRLAARIAAAETVDGSISNVLDVIGQSMEGGCMPTPRYADRAAPRSEDTAEARVGGRELAIDATWDVDVVAELRGLNTVDEVATVLRTTPKSIKREIALGRLRAFRRRESGSSRVLIARAEVARYLRSLAGE